jgi:hypothetical protein
MFCVNVEPWLLSDTLIWVPFSWAQIMLEIEVGVQSGTLVKEQCSHDFYIRLCGTTGLSRNPTCIGTDRTRNHLLFYSILLHFILFYANLLPFKNERLKAGI